MKTISILKLKRTAAWKISQLLERYGEILITERGGAIWVLRLATLEDEQNVAGQEQDKAK